MTALEASASPYPIPGPPPQAVFAGHPESVAHARRYAREVVAWQAPGIRPDRVDDVELVVSELVTNSVRYGTEPGDSLCVAIEAEPDRVRVEVQDPVRRRPRLRPESDVRDRGRGLLIVERLARWGTDDRPMGKVVWAELTW
ncbi:ATP-binding protein [Streptomyces sp. AM 4-1-1]|uniref:ATP-binding protein n=1 Tax=Streptomyces sp. AM 4-1-1 TaxID=3028710 RepID=UPI0023B93406|nr:ATP-binding protein [Streptomyces sp. AM 4-1-1]WEH35273.1 ATP-binding protein [Streptomyces sp. AM 4-1-1]